MNGSKIISLAHSPNYSYLSFALCATFLVILLVIRARRRRREGNNKTSWERLMPGPRDHFLGKYLNLLEIADKRKTVKVVTNWCLEKNDGRRPAMKLEFGPFSAVLLLSPSYIQKLFSSAESEHLAKPFVSYGVLKPIPWFDGLIHSKGDKWRERRKLINPIFNYGSLLSYIQTWNEGGRRLVSTLESRFQQSSSPAPIQSLLFANTFSSLCRTVFGIGIEEKSGGSLDDGEGCYTERFLEGTKRFLEIVATRVLQPWLSYEPLFRLHPLSRELRRFYRFSRKFITRLSNELEDENQNGSSCKDQASSSSSSSSLLKDFVGAGLRDKHIYEEAMTMLITGHETTGSVLHSLLFFIALNPGVQERCRKEVDAVFENDEFCADGTVISARGLKELQYLEQCIMETLRMVPPAPVYGRELEGPLSLDEELELPAGTTVGVWVLGIHMNPQLYPQPERFDPDRFSPEMRAARHPFSYMPFSAGPRKCIGHKFGTMELLVDAAHILRHFTISTTTERFEDVVWLYNTTLRPETPMEFVFQKRNIPL